MTSTIKRPRKNWCSILDIKQSQTKDAQMIFTLQDCSRQLHVLKTVDPFPLSVTVTIVLHLAAWSEGMCWSTAMVIPAIGSPETWTGSVFLVLKIYGSQFNSSSFCVSLSSSPRWLPIKFLCMEVIGCQFLLSCTLFPVSLSTAYRATTWMYIHICCKLSLLWMVILRCLIPSTTVTQIVETLAHLVLRTPHLRTLVDPKSPPEPPPPPSAPPAPSNNLTLLDLWTAGPGAGGGASLRRGVLRDPITLIPASTKALAFLAEDRTQLSLSCAGNLRI